MNIKEAEKQIEYALKAYFEKNSFGEYIIPAKRQRPVFLMGPPGIGKTAVIEQIAQRLNVGLVSYSMTHHTRQSALGLPFITQKTYGGKEFSVSEYTMSEIIASVYDLEESSGFTEGILFLDEINCVSQTLAPAMLQFLQYKIFGQHKLPEGWIIVTAGNPPEYNNSVRDFDIATLDRLKKIDIEPDFDAWKEYAVSQHIHPAILTYLEIKRDNFYKIETAANGKTFVTARGWSDLSDMIRLYEKNNFPVDDALIGQYLQDDDICRDFSVYYDLFQKYRSDYQVLSILEGKAADDIKERAKAAPFDEMLSLISLMLDSLREDFSNVLQKEDVLRFLLSYLKPLKEKLYSSDGICADKELEEITCDISRKIKISVLTSACPTEETHVMKSSLNIFEEILLMVKEQNPQTKDQSFSLVSSTFNSEKAALKALVQKASFHLKNCFDFLNSAFTCGNEMLIFITELTADKSSASFISRYGSDEYFKYSKELMVYEREKEIIKEIEDLGLNFE